jgi:hypothetical protein
MLANKGVYPNLPGSDLSPTLCTWDIPGSTCIPLSVDEGREEDDDSSIDPGEGGLPVVIVVVIIVVAVIVLVATGVVAILLYRRRARLRENNEGLGNLKASEMEVMSSSTSKGSKKKAGFL